MRLLSIHVDGIRRLLDCKCYLGGKITAVVGPNESGKSSLLFALQSITRNDAIAPSSLSRVVPPKPESTVITAHWEVEDADREALSSFDLVAPPVRLTVEKKPDGRRVVHVTPLPERRPEPFVEAIGPLQRFLASAAGRSLERRDKGSDGEPLDGDCLDNVLDDLRSGAWKRWEEANIDLLADAVIILERLGGSAASHAGRAATATKRALAAARLSEPIDNVWRILLERVPPCLEFKKHDRELDSAYDLTAIDIDNAPPALTNLTDLAGLDLQTLVAHVNAGDTGMAATVLRRANDELSKFFKSAWTQSELRVILDRDGLRLDVLVEEVGGSTYTLNERSDGLRAFVALTAFLAKHDFERPVLLIDEAETHLHYDAQRDLVDVLIEQDLAQQVVYTTHSPGCLPPDLGTGVRAVVPVSDRPGVSTIENGFWTSNSPGFSPLLLMMGAGAAAFTTTRAALIVEGPSDMILLPSLIRKALNTSVLPYHVAPGLSVTAPDRYAEFDLVAARLVYVVDGDAGGAALRRKLQSNGVANEKILALGGDGSGLTLEDLVSHSDFLSAFNSELSVMAQPMIASLPAGRGRYKLAERACLDAGGRSPSKIAVAGRLIWQEGGPGLTPTSRKALQKLHRDAVKLLST